VEVEIEVRPKGFELHPAFVLFFPLEKDPERTEEILENLLEALLDSYRWKEIT